MPYFGANNPIQSCQLSCYIYAAVYGLLPYFHRIDDAVVLVQDSSPFFKKYLEGKLAWMHYIRYPSFSIIVTLHTTAQATRYPLEAFPIYDQR